MQLPEQLGLKWWQTKILSRFMATPMLTEGHWARGICLLINFPNSFARCVFSCEIFFFFVFYFEFVVLPVYWRTVWPNLVSLRRRSVPRRWTLPYVRGHRCSLCFDWQRTWSEDQRTCGDCVGQFCQTLGSNSKWGRIRCALAKVKKTKKRTILESLIMMLLYTDSYVLS